MLLSTTTRYYHTLRHLKPVQFYGRLWFRYYRPQTRLSGCPSLRPIEGKWQLPARRKAAMTGADSFCFLGESGSLAEHGWDGPGKEKLWRYNLHYFDDLNALDGSSRKAWHEGVLKRWVAEIPAGQGTAWEPYPTSLRMVNWIKWALSNSRSSDVALPPECVDSLAVQARWLMGRLEIHLLGNHLFANAKALVFAGCFFSGEEAERWLAKGLSILAREIPEQILPDGGHFERSTMYHALALEDMLDLYNLLRTCGSSVRAEIFGPAGLEGWLAQLQERIEAMVQWLNAMRHPDGEISLFNDAALGIAPSCGELIAYAGRIGFGAPSAPKGITHLKQSGYLRLNAGPSDLFLDVAPVGPDYLPGHAHADTLSFEMSLSGERLLVNSGTSCYGLSDERLRQRGTAAHNTVVVDGQNSSEVWSGFRVARRAKPVGLRVEQGSAVTVTCGHDGYRRLPGKVLHERFWSLDSGSLVIKDRLEGSFGTAEARFHFHPDLIIERTSDDSLSLTLPGGAKATMLVARGSYDLKPSTWHPEFGKTVDNQCLRVMLEDAASEVHIQW